MMIVLLLLQSFDNQPMEQWRLCHCSLNGRDAKMIASPAVACRGEWSWWLRDVTKMSQQPFLIRFAAIKSVLVVNDLIGVRRRVRGCLDVHCSFTGVGIGEGFGRHGDDLPLCQLLQFHVGISTPRYGARDHFVVVVIEKSHHIFF